MPSPRSLVGRLLNKARGQDSTPPAVKTTPTPPTAPPPVAAKDTTRATTLYTRLRDTLLVATRNELTLDGALDARKKAIVQALESDRFDEAEALITALGTDLRKAQADAEAAAPQLLKDQLPALRQRAVAARQSRSTSPAIAALIKAMAGHETAIAELIKAKNAVAAVRLMPELDKSIAAITAQEQAEARNYAAALAQADTAFKRITAPVVAPEVAQARKTLVEPAEALATAGDHHAAIAQLGKVAPACVKLEELVTAFNDALDKATQALQAVDALILPMDGVNIRIELIDAAKAKALKGLRQEALALLGKVQARCDAAKQARARVAGAVQAWWDEKFTELMAHAHKDAFATEIAPLQAKRQRALANTEQAIGNVGHLLFSDIHWGAIHLIELADKHALFVTQRDTVVLPLIKQLNDTEPKASALALAAEIKALSDQVDQATGKAGKRLYDVAQGLLATVQQGCAATAKLKLAHADVTRQLDEATRLLDTLPDAKGTPFEAEGPALRARLTGVKAQIDQKAFEAAGDALAVLRQDIDEALRIAQAGQAAREARALALPPEGQAPTADSARTSLAAVRKLLEQLKLHPGKAGIALQIQQITEWLSAADDALKA